MWEPEDNADAWKGEENTFEIAGIPVPKELASQTGGRVEQVIEELMELEAELESGEANFMMRVLSVTTVASGQVDPALAHNIAAQAIRLVGAYQFATPEQRSRYTEEMLQFTLLTGYVAAQMLQVLVKGEEEA